MKKMIFQGRIIGIVVLAMVVMAGCGSAPQSQSRSTGSTGSTGGYQRIIGAEGVPQPEWVRNPGEMETADMMYFVGEGRTGTTKTARKNSAIADGGRQVGLWKESKISAAIKDYVDEAGETGNTQSLERLQVASIQKAQANTSGIKEVKAWIDQNGDYVVLISYPKADLKQDFRSSINTFVRNESAAFAEFKSEEAFKFLEQQLEK